MKKVLQHLISALALTFFAFIAFGSMDEEESASSNETENTVNAKSAGETLTTKYFDVTVNSVSLQDRINTGNQFSDLAPEDGHQYLVLNTTFKNTDVESRMISEGAVLINYNGKDYVFDKSETLMVEGWGTMLDQLNPLTSKTTNLVYKIPQEITGPAFYRPGRAGKSDVISIGDIE